MENNMAASRISSIFLLTVSKFDSLILHEEEEGRRFQAETHQIQIIHCMISILLNLPSPRVTKATKNPAKHHTANTISLVN